MLSEEELQKKWESLTFTDNFIFSHVMHDENICRQVVELILGVRIGKIHYLSAQDEHKTDPDSMRIIMDVFLRDENRIITVEMQTGHKKELPRRSRYYQAAADIDTTPKGSKYKDLKQNYVIFICTFDPFLKGKPIYKFQNLCLEHDEAIYLGDGTEKIFLNTTAKDLTNLDGELRLFYDYIKERTAQTDFTKELDATISRMKQEKEERNMYLTYTSRMMECRQDGYEEGLERGAYQKALETAKTMLSLGLPLDQIQLCTSLPLDAVQELAQTK